MRGVKLVNLGLPKSGTTTLAFALEQAGWRAADHKVRRVHTRDPHLGGTFVARQIYRGYFETGDPFKHLGMYDALTEINVLNGELSCWPQCDYPLLKAMRLRAPSVLFVASWRPAADIADSMARWNNLGERRLPAATVPGLPAGFGSTSAERVAWIEGHYDMLRDVFGDDPRFLELDMAAGDAREKLSAHIKRDLPWWGRKNVNPASPEAGAA